MHPLRRNSSRPELIVDQRAFRILNPADLSRVGIQAPFGRSRVVSVLPVSELPHWSVPPTIIRDHEASQLGDPDGNLIGRPGIHVSRMATARWVEDTRRLAG